MSIYVNKNLRHLRARSATRRKLLLKASGGVNHPKEFMKVMQSLTNAKEDLTRVETRWSICIRSEISAVVVIWLVFSIVKNLFIAFLK
ncbi:MAG: hypothetical protein K2Y18_02640 [Alphaproteobacteria bacterium]|nr:hypothetical protein [Alphaproteobacteria bacterium]